MDIWKSLSDPVSLAILTALIGVITFSFETYKKRKDAERIRKQELYESLLQNVFALLDAAPGSDSSAILSEIEKVWMFATDDVLRACYNVLLTYDQKNNTTIRQDETKREQFRSAVADLFVSIRRDVRGRFGTKIDREWARKQVVVYEWGALYDDNEKNKTRKRSR